MDPYKVPPQGLKNVFKQLRSIKDRDDPRLAAFPILDFTSHTESTERLEFLEKVFDCFNTQTSVTHPAKLGGSASPGKSHTVSGIPGVTILPGVIPPLTQRTLLDNCYIATSQIQAIRPIYIFTTISLIQTRVSPSSIPPRPISCLLLRILQSTRNSI